MAVTVEHPWRVSPHSHDEFVQSSAYAVHHHMHADTPETLAIAEHTAQIQRLSARLAALENAAGQVVGDGT